MISSQPVTREGRGSENLQYIPLLQFDRDRCKPFFDGLIDYFNSYHHSENQDADSYEEIRSLAEELDM